jgi:glutamyl/glutaminyl-tRNA synthetase
VEQSHCRDPLRPGEELAAARWSALDEWTKERLEESLRAFATERGRKAAALIHPVRVALSAPAAEPPLFDLVAALGREQTPLRLDRYRRWLITLSP